MKYSVEKTGYLKCKPETFMDAFKLGQASTGLKKLCIEMITDSMNERELVSVEYCISDVINSLSAGQDEKNS